MTYPDAYSVLLVHVMCVYVKHCDVNRAACIESLTRSRPVVAGAGGMQHVADCFVLQSTLVTSDSSAVSIRLQDSDVLFFQFPGQRRAYIFFAVSGIVPKLADFVVRMLRIQVAVSLVLPGRSKFPIVPKPWQRLRMGYHFFSRQLAKTSVDTSLRPSCVKQLKLKGEVAAARSS